MEKLVEPLVLQLLLHHTQKKELEDFQNSLELVEQVATMLEMEQAQVDMMEEVVVELVHMKEEGVEVG